MQTQEGIERAGLMCRVQLDGTVSLPYAIFTSNLYCPLFKLTTGLRLHPWPLPTQLDYLHTKAQWTMDEWES